ncbi:MAG: MBL fold metallo-hydrolase [Muribaculaceae bacterium]|nr:MBL fold metallo-hydrolase [Muribaculaceae bacterium]
MVKQFINSVFNSNSYVIHNDKDAILIDVGDFTPIQQYLDSQGLALRAVFITHTHYDHIYGVPELMQRYPHLPIYTSEFGKQAFGTPKWNFSRYHDQTICIISDNIISLHHNDIISPCDDMKLRVLATPGHDESCLSFICGDSLFTGDSYIPGVKVIATFPRSDKELANVWYGKLAEISQSYDLYPGHGPAVITATDL